MAPLGIIEHEEFVKDKAKSFDFVLQDDKIQEVWQSVGVAVLGMGIWGKHPDNTTTRGHSPTHAGHTDSGSDDQLCILGVSAQVCRQTGFSAASIVGDSAKHIYTHPSSDEQQLLETSWVGGPAFSGAPAFGPDSSAINVHIHSGTLPAGPGHPADEVRRLADWMATITA